MVQWVRALALQAQGPKLEYLACIVQAYDTGIQKQRQVDRGAHWPVSQSS